MSERSLICLLLFKFIDFDKLQAILYLILRLTKNIVIQKNNFFSVYDYINLKYKKSYISFDYAFLKRRIRFIKNTLAKIFIVACKNYYIN